MTQDKFALDRSSVRTVDVDGRMHVSLTPISKANVCGYYGHEIPNSDALGLDPQRIYQLLRDPDELAKAAPTFNNVPLMIEHVPQSAADPQKDLIVGSTGTNAVFNAPYLSNSLVVWDAGAISGIESDGQRELSSAYRYTADMTPGTFEGIRFDGVMRDIVGNHVALVEKGRAGPDVVVGDSAIKPLSEQPPMAAKYTPLSPRAAVALDALTVHIAPKLAKDAAIDLRAIVAPATAKNWSTQKPRIVAALTAAAKGKLAQDADLADVVALLDKLDDCDDGTDAPVVDPAVDPAVDDGNEAQIRAMLAGKVDDEMIAKIVAMCSAPAAADVTPPMLPAKGAGDEGGAPPPFAKKDDNKEDGDKVDKAAMDAAIAAAVNTATAVTIARLNAINEARELVRPFIGSVAVAMDSAPAVFKLALDHFKTEGHAVDLTGVPETVYGALFRSVAPLVSASASRPAPKAPGMAVDAASAASFAARFPKAAAPRSI